MVPFFPDTVYNIQEVIALCNQGSFGFDTSKSPTPRRVYAVPLQTPERTPTLFLGLRGVKLRVAYPTGDVEANRSNDDVSR